MGAILLLIVGEWVGALVALIAAALVGFGAWRGFKLAEDFPARL